MKKRLKEIELLNLFKFGFTGLIGYLIYAGLLFIFTSKVETHYLLSALIGGEVSLIFMFYIHEKWTFAASDNTKPVLGRLVNFHLVSGTVGLMNLGLLWVFTELAAIHYLLSSLMAVVIAFLFNYFLNLYFTWNK